jgi:hypothetical protein
MQNQVPVTAERDQVLFGVAIFAVSATKYWPCVHWHQVAVDLNWLLILQSCLPHG